MIYSKLDPNDCKDCDNHEKQVAVEGPQDCEDVCKKTIDSDCITSELDIACRGVVPGTLSANIPTLGTAVCLENLAEFFVSSIENSVSLQTTICAGVSDCPAVCPQYSGTYQVGVENEPLISLAFPSPTDPGFRRISNIDQYIAFRFQHFTQYSHYKFEINSADDLATFNLMRVEDNAVYPTLDTVNGIYDFSNINTGVFAGLYFPPAGTADGAYISPGLYISLYNEGLGGVVNDAANLTLRVTAYCHDSSLATTPLDIPITTLGIAASGYGATETVPGVFDYIAPGTAADTCAYTIRQKTATSTNTVEVIRNAAPSLTTKETWYNDNVAIGASRIRPFIRVATDEINTTSPTTTKDYTPIVLNSTLFDVDLSPSAGVHLAYNRVENVRSEVGYEADLYDSATQTYFSYDCQTYAVSSENTAVSRFLNYYSQIPIALTNTNSPSTSQLAIDLTQVSQYLNDGLDTSTFAADYAAATIPAYLQAMPGVSQRYIIDGSANNPGTPIAGLPCDLIKVTLEDYAGNSVTYYVPSKIDTGLPTSPVKNTGYISIQNIPSTFTVVAQFRVGLEVYNDGSCIQTTTTLPLTEYKMLAWS